MSDSRMLPCPFCGETPIMEPWHGGELNRVRIGCDNDDCCAGPSVIGESPVEAMSRWNTRNKQ